MPKYTKFQIAVQYFPYMNERSARRALNRWMQQAKGLTEALEKAGYHRNQKGFMQKHVDLIHEYLGDP